MIRVLESCTNRKAVELSSDGERLRDCWRTPRSLFESLHAVFHFTVDACASASNALLPYYWTRQDDCLVQDWSQHVVFCNPPFSKQKLIPAKAATARQAVVFLFQTGLFTRYMNAHPPSCIAFPAKRISFIPPTGIHALSNPSFGVAICVYGSITDQQRQCLATIGLVLQQEKGTPMSVQMTEKDLARANLKVSDDGTALVRATAVDDADFFTRPPTVAVMPGENAVVRPAEPDAAWPLSDLVQYAKERLCGVSVSIFQAGRALRLARDQFKKERAWGKWLKQHGIPRTSAWEAIELFEKAKSEDALAGLTRGQALKKFDVRPSGKKARGGGDGAGNGSRKPPKPPAAAASGESPRPKEDTLLLKLTKIKSCLDLCYEQRSRIDWSREDAIACMKVIDGIYQSMDDVINEVHPHVVVTAAS